MSQENPQTAPEAAPSPKKSPLQLKKELQASLQSNRAAKEKRPDPGASKQTGSQVSGAKPMRSSASKQGG